MMEDIWIIISTLLNQPTTLVLSLVTWKDSYIYTYICIYIYLNLYLYLHLALSLSSSVLTLTSIPLNSLSLAPRLPSLSPSLSVFISLPFSCSPYLHLREEEEGVCLGEEPALPHSDAGSANRNCEYLFLSRSPLLT